MSARTDSVIAIILSVFSSVVCDVDFCLTIKKAKIPGRTSKENSVAGNHMM